MILGVMIGKNKDRLQSHLEMELFLKIKEADDLRTVEKEMTMLYRSLSAPLWSKLYKTFKRFIPPRVIEDLENTFQAGWKTVLEKRKLFQPEKSKSVFNWFFTIFRNITNNVFKRESKVLSEYEIKHNEESESKTEFELLDLPDDITPYEIANSNLLLDIIDKIAQTELTESQRKSFFLRVENNYTYKEIAEELGISISMVHKNLNNACDKLRSYLKLRYNIDEKYLLTN